MLLYPSPLNFLSHTHKRHPPPKKNVHITTEQNADDQVFLFHVAFIFFVKNRILRRRITINIPFLLEPKTNLKSKHESLDI